MAENDWLEEAAVAVTVCDADGRIIGMNARAREVFAADGGAALMGTNVLDCHPEPSRTKLVSLMRERRTNVYTIEKNGRRKLIHQSPWFRDGVYSGFVELAIDLPDKLPHFVRG